MIGVDDHRGIFQPLLFVHIDEPHQILVVIVGDVVAVHVHTAAQYRVRVGVAIGAHLAGAVLELVGYLRRIDRVERDGKAAVHRILYPAGDVHAARDKPVLLVFGRTRADRDIGQEVVEVDVILGIEHLVGGGKPALRDRPQMHLAKRDYARLNVRLVLVRIGVVQYPLVALTLGARLVGVYAWDDKDLFLDLFGKPGKAVHIVADRRLVVRRTRSDNDHQPLVVAAQDRLRLFVAARLDRGDLRRDGLELLDLFGRHDLFDLDEHITPPLRNLRPRSP